MTDDITLSLAWVHGFRNALEGEISQLLGALVKFDTQYDSIVAGLNIQFGGRRRGLEVAAVEPVDRSSPPSP